MRIEYLKAANKFLGKLKVDYRAQIRADLESVAQHGLRAPVSLRTITDYSPMIELKNGGYRTFFFVDSGVLWVLACCKKQDQKTTIRTAYDRLKATRGR